MLKATQKEKAEDFQLPTEDELDNVLHEVVFMGLANFLPDLEDGNSESNNLGEITRQEMADRIRAEYDTGVSEAVRIIKFTNAGYFCSLN